MGNDRSREVFEEAYAHVARRNDVAGITEDGVALEFVERHLRDLRYDHSAEAWFRFVGTHWRRDKTMASKAEIRSFARELGGLGGPKARRMTAKTSFWSNVERAAKIDQRIAVTADHWDRDLYLLGTPEGVVDLRTGDLRPARPEDFITKLAAAGPAAVYRCEPWDRFLREATGGDASLARFLQLLGGYALTGDTKEEIFAFIYGPGGNGKGVFLGTLAKAFGDYHVTADMDAFTASKHERHTTEIAKLAGARLVTATEVTEGRAWDETRLKTLTGSVKVSARFLFKDAFEFVPQFFLMISGNHKPKLQNVTEAMTRRLRMLPFMNKPDVVNPNLKKELEQPAVLAAILRWLIDGCLLWQREGLQSPEPVSALTADYFKGQDKFNEWFEATLVVERDTKKRLVQLDAYKSWSYYAERAGIDAGTIDWFDEQMARPCPGLHDGFKRKWSHNKWRYPDVRFRTSNERSQDDQEEMRI